jgi:uncharacterized membrane protein
MSSYPPYIKKKSGYRPYLNENFEFNENFESIPNPNSEDNLKYRKHHDDIENVAINSENNDNTTCKLPKKKSIKELVYESFFEFAAITMIIGASGVILSLLLELNMLIPFHFVGLLVSLVATYYKYKVWVNPSYKSSYCNCSNASYKETKMKGILTVLDHKKGSLLFNIPNSLFGIFYYASMLFIDIMELMDILLVKYLVLFLMIVSCVGSCFLWYTMVFQIRSICILCMTIHAINLLSLVGYYIAFVLY